MIIVCFSALKFLGEGMLLPKNFRLVYSKEQIEERVSMLARQIDAWCTADESVLAIPILRGSLYFFSDLTKKMQPVLELAPIFAKSYQGQTQSEIKLFYSKLEAKGRRVLLIDEICDSGNTLKKCQEDLLGLGALEIKTAVLIKRDLKDSKFNPDYIAFNNNTSDWFVGYGMDHNERYSNLPEVYAVDK